SFFDGGNRGIRSTTRFWSALQLGRDTQDALGTAVCRGLLFAAPDRQRSVVRQIVELRRAERDRFRRARALFALERRQQTQLVEVARSVVGRHARRRVRLARE